jgi:hypothetical protein
MPVVLGAMTRSPWVKVVIHGLGLVASDTPMEYNWAPA